MVAFMACNGTSRISRSPKCGLGAEHDSRHDQRQSADREKRDDEKEGIDCRRPADVAGAVLRDEKIDPLADLFPGEGGVVRVGPLVEATVGTREGDHRTSERIIDGCAGSGDRIDDGALGAVPAPSHPNATEDETRGDGDSEQPDTEEYRCVEKSTGHV